MIHTKKRGNKMLKYLHKNLKMLNFVPKFIGEQVKNQ